MRAEGSDQLPLQPERISVFFVEAPLGDIDREAPQVLHGLVADDQVCIASARAAEAAKFSFCQRQRNL